MWGLNRTDATSASLLLNVEGVTTLGLAWLIFRENANLRIILGACAIIGGAMLVSWQGSLGGFSWGSLAAVAACVTWAIDNNLTRKLSGSDPVSIAAWKGLAAGAVNVVLAVSLGALVPEIDLLLSAGAVGLFGYGTSLILFVLALRYLGVARTGAYYSTAPFIGATVAVLLLNDPLTTRLIVAGALMAFGVLVHILEVHAHWHRHESLEHEHRHLHDAHHDHHRAPDTADLEHSHWHRHEPAEHSHPHYPDLIHCPCGSGAPSQC